MSWSYIRNKLLSHNRFPRSTFMNKQFIHPRWWMLVKNLDKLIRFNSTHIFFSEKKRKKNIKKYPSEHQSISNNRTKNCRIKHTHVVIIHDFNSSMISIFCATISFVILTFCWQIIKKDNCVKPHENCFPRLYSKVV